MKIVFAGTPHFAARHLEALIESEHQVAAVITQPDKPGKRGKELVPSPVKVIAQEFKLSLLQPERLRTADLRVYQADIIAVVAYGQILQPALLNLPQFGCINVHASLLPKWRGAAPIQRALLAGDTRTGITIIQMDPGIDTGDILATEATPIAPDDTSLSLQSRLADLGAGLLLRVLNQIEAGEAKALPQPSGTGAYADKILPQEACIDWTASPQMIDRQIRAFNPEPVAYGYLHQNDLHQSDLNQSDLHQNDLNQSDLGQKAPEPMRVRFQSAVLKDWSHTRPPGEVLSVTNDGVAVALSSGALVITRIQLPIGKGTVLTGQDLLNARKNLIYPGVRFSNSVSNTNKSHAE